MNGVTVDVVLVVGPFLKQPSGEKICCMIGDVCQDHNAHFERVVSAKVGEVEERLGSLVRV